MLTLIKKVNVVEQVIEYINECLKEGVWKPGDKIDSENVLTQKLEVSRASIRYAIQQFVALGVLESHHGKGTYVKSVPVEDLLNRMDMMYKGTELKQLLEFRMAIETEVCLLIANTISDQTLSKLENCLVAMQEAKTKDEAILRDMEFHTLLHYETKNRLIIRSMESIREETMKQLMIQILDEKTALEYHKKIYSALKARDGVAAADAMRSHILKSIEKIKTLDLAGEAQYL